jgi:ABC-type transport system substrate-binding protein
LKTKLLLALMLVSLLAIIPMFPRAYAQPGPEMDVLRHVVIKSPDAALIAMQTGIADFSPDQIRTADIEKQDADGMLITQDLGFHMGFIGWNLREDQTYRDRTEPYWPLKDVEFRHALIHAYDQLGIIPPIYGYIVTPVRSLVPPAQSKYYNPAVPEHPYNPGDPFTHEAGTACGILWDAGYRFNDAGTTGVVDDADFWRCPDNSPIPHIDIFTPLMEVAPTSYQHAAEFVSDLAQIGLASTSANGGQGLLNLGWDFNEYLDLVYYGAYFDAYMVFYSLGRIPSQLYSMLHTSQDSRTLPGANNAPGVNDPAIDDLTETVKFSLDTDDIEAAAKEAQRMLYTTTETNADNFALAYMLLYSRSYFNAFDENLEGIVKSPGYGSDNSWTFLGANWKPGFERQENGDNVLIYINGEEPDSFNPCYATTVYEYNIIGQVQDSLTAVNPYNHYDMPWIASSWTITEVGGGMEIDFTLRSDVDWQDGLPVTAADVEFNLEFFRDYQVPRYAETWMSLTDVSVTDPTHLTIVSSDAGIDLFYDYSGLALFLPTQVWDGRFGDPSDPVVRQAVLDYDPTEAYSGPGSGVPTNLFGTGPWIFQFYDAVNLYDDMTANRNYFMDQAATAALMTQMFWEVGDQSKDGIVNVLDLTFVSFAYGYMVGDPEYDPDADFNSDTIVDMRDMRTSAFHLLWQMEYP